MKAKGLASARNKEESAGIIIIKDSNFNASSPVVVLLLPVVATECIIHIVVGYFNGLHGV